MTQTSLQEPPTASGSWALPRAVARALRPSALEPRLRAIDADPRVIGLGVAIGIVYAVLMAGGIDRQYPRLAEALVALALAAPTAGISIIATLAMFREPAGLAPLNFNATIVGACALAVVLRLVVRGLNRERIVIRPEFAAIGGYLGLSTFQFLWVTLGVARAREQWARTELTEAVAGLILLTLIAVLFSHRTRGYLLAAMVPGIVLAAAVAIISLSPSLVGALPIAGWLPLEDISARGTGFFHNPNYLGQAMAMALILVARGRRMAIPGPLPRWSAVLGVVVALAAIASFSRGALLAAAAGIVVLYVSRGRRVALAAAAVGAAIVLIGYQLLLVTRHVLTFGPAIAAAADAQAASDAARLTVYKAGIQMFLQHPVFGVGYGQFHYESVKYMPEQAITFSHNVFLGVAVEQGLPGILVFLLMLGAIGYALRQAGDQVALTAGSMFVAFAVGSLFAEDLTSLQTSCVLWVAIGCALAPPPSRGEPLPNERLPPGQLPADSTSLRSATRGPIRSRSSAAGG